jgi:apolipoprotein D and lipocalin family protein
MPLNHSITFLILTAGLFGAAPAPKLEPVRPFDLNRYLGRWYEIARLPAPFERDLTHVTATYTLNPKGNVTVLNEGHNGKNGKQSKAVGRAKLAKAPDVGHLKVSFFGPFYADYVVLALDEEYRYALVASSMKYLWILSRTPQLDQTIIDRLVEKARGLGFATEKLYFTPQE